MNETVVTIVGIVVSVPCSVTGVCLAMHADKKIRQYGLLFLAGGSATQTVMNALLHNTFPAAWNAGITAVALWLWWTRGGGDGLKRRFKAWADSLGRSPQTT